MECLWSQLVGCHGAAGQLRCPDRSVDQVSAVEARQSRAASADARNSDRARREIPGGIPFHDGMALMPARMTFFMVLVFIFFTPAPGRSPVQRRDRKAAATMTNKVKLFFGSVVSMGKFPGRLQDGEGPSGAGRFMGSCTGVCRRRPPMGRKLRRNLFGRIRTGWADDEVLGRRGGGAVHGEDGPL